MIENYIIMKAAELYNGDANNSKLLGGFFENVYSIHINGKEYVLKLMDKKYFKKEQLVENIKWIQYLKENGVNVMTPVKSINNQYLEFIDQNYYCSVYEKANGHLPKQVDMNDTLFKKWGEVLGKIHKLAKTYGLKDGVIKHWNEDHSFNLNIIDDAVKEKWLMLQEQLHNMPKDVNSYGLIHHDLHQQNFHINGEEIILFDFGDCIYGWFIYDIVISLYHVIQFIENGTEKSEIASYFMKHFLKGYQEQNQVEGWWFQKIPMLLEYRRIYSYLYVISYLDVTQEPIRTYIKHMREKIINGVPYIEKLKIKQIY